MTTVIAEGNIQHFSLKNAIQYHVATTTDMQLYMYMSTCAYIHVCTEYALQCVFEKEVYKFCRQCMCKYCSRQSCMPQKHKPPIIKNLNFLKGAKRLYDMP